MNPDLESQRSYLRVLAGALLADRRVDRSDVVQETLLRAVERRDQFAGATAEELRGWLRRIMACVIVDGHRAAHARKRRPDRMLSLNTMLDNADRRLAVLTQSSVVGGALRNEECDRLTAALLTLPEDQRQAIELHHLAGLPVSKTALALGRTDASVAGLLRRGLASLREQLTDSQSTIKPPVRKFP